MTKSAVLVGLGVAVLAGGCATTYQPLKVDTKTAQYPTSVQIAPGGIQKFVTTVDPRQFAAVLLLTESNYRPATFAFMIRDALAQVGITNVYTRDEFALMAGDRHFSVGQLDSNTIRSYSETQGPVLVVSATFLNTGGANTLTEMSIQDGRTGQVLLKLNHTRLVWWSFDSEALYPVLNKMRDWVKSSAGGAT